MSCYKRMNNNITVTAETEAIKAFRELEPNFISKASGSYYDTAEQEFSLALLNQEYLVSYPEGKVKLKESAEAVPELDRTILLQYLAFACGLPPRGHWINFLELPDGAHHNGPFQLQACLPLINTFGDKPELFMEIGKSFGGEVLKMGDASFKLRVLPKIELAFVLWEADEEFPARANVLFEAVTPTYLTTAWLYCLGIEVALKLVEEAKGR